MASTYTRADIIDTIEMVGSRIYLIEQKLHGIDLSGLDLHEADLTRADMRGAHLSGHKIVQGNYGRYCFGRCRPVRG